MAALWDAGVYPREVDQVNTHVKSTSLGDVVDILALCKTLLAYREDCDAMPLLVISTKTQTGHLLGAARALEAAFAALSVRGGLVPPNANLGGKVGDDAANALSGDSGEMEFQSVVMRRGIQVEISISFGFGGINVSLVFQMFEP